LRKAYLRRKKLTGEAKREPQNRLTEHRAEYRFQKLCHIWLKREQYQTELKKKLRQADLMRKYRLTELKKRAPENRSS